MLVPLLFGPRLLGLLKLSSLQPGSFTQSDVFVVGRFVEKMSTTIRNAGLYGRRLAELRAINDIGKLVTRPLPLEETCASILDIVLRVLNLAGGSIELIDREGGRLRVLASRGYEGTNEGLLLGEGITGTVALTGEPILANDARSHPQYVMRSPAVCSELAVPIVFEGTTVGVLNVESLAPDRFSGRDLDFLSILADKTATALETLEQREHRRATLALLHELSTRLVGPDYLGRLLQETVDLTHEHLSCEVASIFLFENGRYRRRATSGLPADWFPEESYGSGEGLTGRAAVLDRGPHLQSVATNDVPSRPEAKHHVWAKYAERLASGRVLHLIAVPLIEGDRPVGVVRVINRLTRDGRLVPGGFIQTDVTLLTTIASQLSLAIANFRKRDRIQQMTLQLENKVRQRTEEVHRLAMFVENAPLAILEVDPKGVLRFINEAGERMFGYQAAELRDRQVIGEGTELLGEAFSDLIKVVEYMSFWAGEVTYRRSDGKTAPAFLSARTLRDPEGKMRGIVIFARDVSQTKELERQLLEAEGKRAMADLAGGVAHDLNNALGSILPMIQALQADVEDGHVDSEQFLADLRRVEGYTRLSVRIFQGMLAMSRGTFSPDKQVNVNERIETALDLLSLRLEKSPVRIVRELQPDLPHTLAHPGRLEQVFHNLMNNAIEAMPDGGTLTLRTWSDGTSIFVEVEDTGAGIAEDMLARVQEPFYTSKRHGTGLGLSVVRSIVWEHNGQMSMRSQVGKGTTVRLEIPIRTALAPSEEERP
jgi:PAS domain S-box-containing protein